MASVVRQPKFTHWDLNLESIAVSAYHYVAYNKPSILILTIGAGDVTCAGYPASLGKELLDAQTFAGWGVDCRYSLTPFFPFPKAFSSPAVAVCEKNYPKTTTQTLNTTIAPTHPPRLTNTSGASPIPRIQKSMLAHSQTVPAPRIPIWRQKATTGRPQPQRNASWQCVTRSRNRPSQFCFRSASGAKQM